jgi:hypothetical protein
MMINMTSGGTAPRRGARGAGSPLPLGSVPFTTVTVGSVGGPKLPPYQGDSWRPAAVGVLGAVPLAVVSAALVGASVVGGAPGVSPRPAGVVPARHAAALSLGSVPFTTVTTGRVTDTKIPEAAGD